MENQKPHDLDELDVKILQLLQVNARLSNAEIGRQINLSQPALYQRIRRLERGGYIQRYVALLDRELLGYDLLCFILLRMQTHDYVHIETFRKAVRQMPEVLECHHLTGEYDYLLKVVVPNRKALERFVVGKLSPVQGIGHIQTSIVFAEVKASTELPLE